MTSQFGSNSTGASSGAFSAFTGLSKPSNNVVKDKYFEKKNKNARITAKVKRVRGTMIESEEILDAKSLIQSLEESQGAWLEL